MTRTEMINMVNDIIKNFDEDGIFLPGTGEFEYGGYIGVRFENKVREVGELIEDKSRANFDREDARDFPEYGTDEYFDMEELNGVCAYDARRKVWHPSREEDVEKNRWIGEHCYVLWSEDMEYGEDDGEFIMEDAQVVAVLY